MEANRVLNAVDEGKVLTVVSLVDSGLTHEGDIRKLLKHMGMEDEDITYWFDFFRIDEHPELTPYTSKPNTFYFDVFEKYKDAEKAIKGTDIVVLRWGTKFYVPKVLAYAKPA